MSPKPIDGAPPQRGSRCRRICAPSFIEGVRGRDKAEAIEILEQALASTASPGISRETIEASRRELRGG